ncbi:hypothetical protein GPA10_24915 [Streptomyces sp. p1417]|uniref:Uncharacterized protein n=1 Tax=Streptomyces typhae TaxID=2681492 RepID=A0A6L6X2P3_9ACTN|nr:hypothetical protein [Streptomyces typhae]
MSEALDKAEAAAREAAQDTDVLRIVAAVLATQQAAQQQDPAPAAQQPIKAHPWGTYAAAGCFGLLALVLVVVLVMFVVFGLTILAAVLGLVVVALTICVLVLRGMWRDYQKGH